MTRFSKTLLLATHLVSASAFSADISLRTGEETDFFGHRLKCEALVPSPVQALYADELTGLEWRYVGVMPLNLAPKACSEINFELPNAVQYIVAKDRIAASLITPDHKLPDLVYVKTSSGGAFVRPDGTLHQGTAPVTNPIFCVRRPS